MFDAVKIKGENGIMLFRKFRNRWQELERNNSLTALLKKGDYSKKTETTSAKHPINTDMNRQRQVSNQVS